MEYFVISAKFVPLKYYTLSSQLQRLALVFSWVFGSANSVTRPDQYNAKMVYTVECVSYINVKSETTSRIIKWF